MPAKKPVWNDVTSYSRGDRDRIPRSFEIEIGRIRMVVTRKIGCPKEKWYLDLYAGLPIEQELAHEDLRGAKLEALGDLKVTLRTALDQIEAAQRALLDEAQ